MTKLRTALFTLVGGLVSFGCVEETESRPRDLPLSKVCELTNLQRLPSKEECEELCDDDDVDGCALSVPGTVSLCAPESAKTDATSIRGALTCNTTSLELGDPFASKGPEPTGTGRRPEGFAGPTMAVFDLGTFFAACHELEAASVDAFERLVRELTTLGAPESLVDRARGAKRDEIRHARWTAVLSRRHGCEPWSVAPAPLSVRSLFEMALENAVEGVVRETFGAASALYSAHRIADPRIRRVMKRIAEDEIRHAELSWDVGAFAATRLDASELRLIARATHEALSSLEDDVTGTKWLRSQAGLPDRRAVASIVERLRELLAEANLFGSSDEARAA